MNPRHRDRVAFVRICSGRLAKDMAVVNERLGTTLRLSRVYRFFGRDRETVPEAYPGRRRRSGQPGPAGDRRHALCRPARCAFRRSRSFPRSASPTCGPADVRHKRFDEAVSQLEEEGLMQVFMPQSRPAPPDRRRRRLAAVRRHRGAAAVGVRHPLCHRAAAARGGAVAGARVRRPEAASLTTSGRLTVKDRQGRDVVLFESAWELRYAGTQPARSLS